MKKSSLIWRLLNPLNWWRIWRLEKNKKKTATAQNDPQLQFYSELLPSGFLHYGYFTNPDIDPSEISFSDLESAQMNYARKLLDHIVPDQLPTLDAGCGMGGLLPLLEDMDAHPVALTPDIRQAQYIRRKYPDIPLHNSRFEALALDDYKAAFSNIIMSESFQYMNMKAAMSRVEQFLTPGGRWVVCDYFRIRASEKSSGHILEEFMETSREYGLKVKHVEDITANILPTLTYAKMMVNRMIMPSLNFADYKFRVKHPGFYSILTPEIEMLNGRVQKITQKIEPDHFTLNKRYKLIALEKI